MLADRPTTRAPEFPVGLDWVGTSGPLTLDGLRGKVVVLDFWTAGCINCLHVIPRLRQLEDRFPNELVVIGVHAGKYPGERRTDAVRRARDRLGVGHPVVNDRQFRIWKSYAVDAWPTIGLVSPDGMLVGLQSGEFDVEEIAAAIARVATASEGAGTLRRGDVDFGVDPEALGAPSGALRYPGRVIADGGTLYVADSGHHRVLELTARVDRGSGGLRSKVARSWGGSAGFADGGQDDARFADPQGLAIVDRTLYIADRANHAVRAIALDGPASGLVRTVAGTGMIAVGAVVPGAALETSMRSPWGLAHFDGALCVSMAGSHQLWRHDFVEGVLSPLAGSGMESLTDGPAHSATLAQPMGLAAGGRGLYFADAESSAVRAVGPGRDASVRTFVGTGLFDHGDRDGTGDDVLLQHCEDLAVQAGRILVADTYNHKLKSVDLASRRCEALPGDAGSGRALLHPSGIWAKDERVLVADTENHRIVSVDPTTGSIAEIEVS